MARCRVGGAMRRVCFFAALVAAVPLCGWPQAAPARQQVPPATQPPVATPSAAPAAAQAPSPSAPAPSSIAGGTAGGVIAGVIKSGQTPLPGVNVTAKNTLTGKQY